jgi:hypothetical protein
MDIIRNFAGALALGSNDGLYLGRAHSHFACHRSPVPRYSSNEWPPGSVIVIRSCEGAGIVQPPFRKSELSRIIRTDGLRQKQEVGYVWPKFIKTF